MAYIYKMERKLSELNANIGMRIDRVLVFRHTCGRTRCATRTAHRADRLFDAHSAHTRAFDACERKWANSREERSEKKDMQKTGYDT